MKSCGPRKETENTECWERGWRKQKDREMAGGGGREVVQNQEKAVAAAAER